MRSLRIAFGLLTTLPLGLPEDWKPGDSGRAGIWYPLVGAAIGALVWLSWRGLNLYFPPLIAGVLAVLIWVGLTGGLHLDGLADCCDGLFVSAPRERRLEIMKDPHLGTFGAIGLILILFTKSAALVTLAPAMGLGIILAAAASRWLILPVSLFPQARPDGMGADFAAGLPRYVILVAAVVPLGLAFWLGLAGGWALLAGLGTGALVVAVACKQIGGVTGDVFGLLVEVSETAILLSLTAGVR